MWAKFIIRADKEGVVDYITDWSEIDSDGEYVVFAIAARQTEGYYLYRPEMYRGSQVKNLMAKCYVALPMPACDFTFLKQEKNDA